MISCRRAIFIASMVLLNPAFGALSSSDRGRLSSAEQGMVIRGDQEAPLVLYIIPWQDPKLPEIPLPPLTPLLPKVFDHEHSLIEDPANRTLDVNRIGKK